MINVGDRVERIAEGKSDFEVGEEGIVVRVSGDYRNVDVELDNGDVSTGNAPSKLRVLSRSRSTNRAPAQPTMLRKLNSFMRQFLDSDVQTLVKAGFINGDLEPTAEGIDALHSVLFQEKKAELVKIAEAIVADAEKKHRE